MLLGKSKMEVERFEIHRQIGLLLVLLYTTNIIRSKLFQKKGLFLRQKGVRYTRFSFHDVNSKNERQKANDH